MVGVIPGTGIGPEVMHVSLRVLEALAEISGLEFTIRKDGPVGEEAEDRVGVALPDSVLAFCRAIWDEGGAILCGPGGGRFVYDLRRKLGLFCKFAPVRRWPELARVGPFVPAHVKRVDILFVRDNVGGVYQGRWKDSTTLRGRVARHSFSYGAAQVRRLAEVAARAASARRGKLHVIVKDGGIPSVSSLWRDVTREVAGEHRIEWTAMNVDLAAYELIQHPLQFDVVLTPNLLGDVLIDVAGVLQGSRGVAVSGNFRPDGKAVFQTNHGCARDLAGAGTANPAAQILSLAMLLRESFQLEGAAVTIERALREAWREGWRTADLAEPGSSIVGTREMGERIVSRILQSR